MNEMERAEAIRAACLAAASAAYEDAGFQGLCAEGRWEAAVGAVQSLDLRALLEALTAQHDPGNRPSGGGAGSA